MPSPLRGRIRTARKKKKNIVPTILARRSFSHPPKKKVRRNQFYYLTATAIGSSFSSEQLGFLFFFFFFFFSLFPSSSFLIESREKRNQEIGPTRRKRNQTYILTLLSHSFYPSSPGKKGKPQKVSHQKRLFLFFLLEQKATRVGETCDCFISCRGFVLVLGLARLTRAIPVIFLLGICRCSTITSQTLTCQGKNKTPPRPSF